MVFYNDRGFPDFSPYRDYQVDLPALGASREADFAAANRAIGKPEWGTGAPAGYTWHHVENSSRLQLVEDDVHARSAIRVASEPEEDDGCEDAGVSDFVPFMAERGVPATAQELVALEELVGGPVPPDYREFLLTCNGGRLRRNLLPIIAPWGVNATPVTRLLAAGGDSFRSSVAKAYRFYISDDEQRMPPNCLPIGADPGGNYVLLSCEAATFGVVYFWDHERENPEKRYSRLNRDFANTITPVAASFTELITTVLLAEDELDRTLAQARSRPLPAMLPPDKLKPYTSPPPPGISGPADTTQVYGIRTQQYRGYDSIFGIKTPESYESTTTPIVHSWEPPTVAVSADGSDQPVHLDVLCRESSLVLRPAAKDHLAPYLNRFGELLSLHSNQGELFLFHCTNEIDAMRPGSYKPDSNSSQGHYRLVKEYEFDVERLAAEEIFTLPQPGFRQRIFFTRPAAEAFTDLCAVHGLAHIPLQIIWPLL